MAEGQYSRDAHLTHKGHVGETPIELEERLSQAASLEDVADAKKLLLGTTGLSYERCSRCGSISTLPEAFRATRKGPLCPACQVRSQPRQHAGLLATLSIILFFLLPALAWNAQFEVNALVEGWAPPPILRWSPYLLWNPLLTLVLAALLVIPHELCHAAAALAARGKVLEVRVFEGPVRWQRRFRGTVVAVGSYPLTGHCIAVFPFLGRLKQRTLWLIAAGPLFNILAILALLPFYDGSRLAGEGAWVELLLIANAVLLISALFPYRASPGGAVGLSDGLHLLNLASGKYSDADLHLSYLSTEAVHLLRSGRYEQALDLCERGLSAYPGSGVLENTKAVALLEMGEHQQALAIFDELLARVQSPDPPVGPGLNHRALSLMEPLLWNNVAYTILVIKSDPQAPHRAREYARRAFRMAPWVQAIRGTWGAVLIETGDVEEGLVHVSDAAREADTSRAKAANLAHAAIGYHRLGRADEATRLLGEARHLDPASIMVKRAEAELALVA
jgi:tetratricopeptide (TPR) repeat protein